MSDNYSFYFGHVPFDSKIYSADEVDGIVDDLRREFGEKTSYVYRYRGTVQRYSDLPVEGNEPGDVWNVEEDSTDAGMNYAWVNSDDSNDQGHWDPLGPSLAGYATKDYVDEGLSGKMPANATGEDILATSSGPLTLAQAMEGNATAIGSIGTQAGNTAEALSDHVSDDVAHVTASDKSWWNGKASVEDATLNRRGPNHDGFSEFKLVDAPAGVTMVSQPNYNNDDDDWALTIEYDGDTFLGVTSGGFDGNELSITIDFDGISPSGPVGITATREALPGYVLGDQVEKPLADADEMALKTKVHLPSGPYDGYTEWVVSPSSDEAGPVWPVWDSALNGWGIFRNGTSDIWTGERTGYSDSVSLEFTETDFGSFTATRRPKYVTIGDNDYALVTKEWMDSIGSRVPSVVDFKEKLLTDWELVEGAQYVDEPWSLEYVTDKNGNSYWVCHDSGGDSFMVGNVGDRDAAEVSGRDSYGQGPITFRRQTAQSLFDKAATDSAALTDLNRMVAALYRVFGFS